MAPGSAFGPPLFPAPGGSHDAPPAFIRATVTDIELLQLGQIGACALILVIIGELNPRLNVFKGIYPDPLIVDDGLAIRVAGMVDETRDVASDVAVDAGVIVESEE